MQRVVLNLPQDFQGGAGVLTGEDTLFRRETDGQGDFAGGGPGIAHPGIFPGIGGIRPIGGDFFRQNQKALSGAKFPDFAIGAENPLSGCNKVN